MKNLDLHEKTINIDISPSRKQKKKPTRWKNHTYYKPG